MNIRDWSGLSRNACSLASLIDERVCEMRKPFATLVRRFYPPSQNSTDGGLGTLLVVLSSSTCLEGEGGEGEQKKQAIKTGKQARVCPGDTRLCARAASSSRSRAYIVFNQQKVPRRME